MSRGRRRTASMLPPEHRANRSSRYAHQGERPELSEVAANEHRCDHTGRRAPNHRLRRPRRSRPPRSATHPRQRRTAPPQPHRPVAFLIGQAPTPQSTDQIWCPERLLEARPATPQLLSRNALKPSSGAPRPRGNHPSCGKSPDWCGRQSIRRSGAEPLRPRVLGCRRLTAA